MARLTLDRDKVESCRRYGEKISKNLFDFIDSHTSISVEAATLRLFGVGGMHKDKLLTHAAIETLSFEEQALGICYWLSRALASEKTTPSDVCLKVVEGTLRFQDCPDVDSEERKNALAPVVEEALRRLDQSRGARREKLMSYPSCARPLKYVVVSSGNRDQDLDTARESVRLGADCVEFRGDYGLDQLQEDFKKIRETLDEVAGEVGRYVRFVFENAGVDVAEKSVIAALEKTDYLLTDFIHDILLQKVNMRRSIVDHYFSRLVMARAGIVMNTNDLVFQKSGASRLFPQIVAAQILNERFSLMANMGLSQVGGGHAFLLKPDTEDGFSNELAEAYLIRDLFPKAPIKYLPPHSGDIPSLFPLVAILSGHEIVQVVSAGSDSFNPKDVQRMTLLAGTLSDDLELVSNGRLVRMARTALDDTADLLQKVDRLGFFKFLEEGILADVVCEGEGGDGLDGLIRKSTDYRNPLQDALSEKLEEETERISSHHSTRPPPPRGRGRQGSRRPPVRGRGRKPPRGGRGGQRSSRGRGGRRAPSSQ